MRLEALHCHRQHYIVYNIGRARQANTVRCCPKVCLCLLVQQSAFVYTQGIRKGGKREGGHVLQTNDDKDKDQTRRPRCAPPPTLQIQIQKRESEDSTPRPLLLLRVSLREARRWTAAKKTRHLVLACLCHLGVVGRFHIHRHLLLRLNFAFLLL